MTIADRTTGALSWGYGFRYGAEAALSLSVLTAYIDLYRTGVSFDAGPAAGFSDIRGVMVGIALR